jgi:hypothetical protein
MRKMKLLVQVIGMSRVKFQQGVVCFTTPFLLDFLLICLKIEFIALLAAWYLFPRIFAGAWSN